jgi:hypothetical protein
MAKYGNVLGREGGSSFGRGMKRGKSADKESAFNPESKSLAEAYKRW